MPFALQSLAWLMLQCKLGCGKWRLSVFQESQPMLSIGPLTEITPPLYNPKPLLCGGQKVKREHCGSTDKQTISTVLNGSFPVLVLQCCVLLSTGTPLLSHPMWVRLGQPITEPRGSIEAQAPTSCSSIATASLNLSEPFLLPPPHTRKASPIQPTFRKLFPFTFSLFFVMQLCHLPEEP